MSNMIDMYLSMNSCVRNKNDDIFLVDVFGKQQYVGKLTGHRVEGSTLHIDVTAKQSINFINFKFTVTKDGVEFEK